MELTRPLDEPALDQRPCRGPTDYSYTESTTNVFRLRKINAPIEACMMALEDWRREDAESRGRARERKNKDDAAESSESFMK